jgi:benzaldehyde dehydrogenase (NAD)
MTINIHSTSDASYPRSRSAAYIEGGFRSLAEHVDVLDKATGTVLGMAGLGSIADLDAAVAAARRAQAPWAAQPYPVRAALVRAAAEHLRDRADEFADLIVRETGSIRGKAEYEVAGAIDELYAAAALAGRPTGEILASQDPGRTSIAQRIPVGVVAVLTPWNFPLILAMRVVAPAIALGNTVILKPSPETPLSGGLAIASLFDEADAPMGVFQTICGELEFSEALTTHPGVDMVHFTGSTAVGSRIASAAGGLLKKVSLELGGNNALVVLDDADLERATMIGAWSSFHYQGQTCISAGRHLVHASIVDEYVSRLAERAHRITVGDPTDSAIGLGPIVNARQAKRAASLLHAATERGATIVEGGTQDGRFFRPTVVTGLSRDMALWTDEVFAPIAPIMPFNTDEEAISLVNDTAYGLVNSVLTGNEARGFAFANQVRSGMVHVNDATCLDEAAAPFGGLGASGVGGRSGGEANLEEFTQRKWISSQHGMPVYPY